MTLNFFSLFIAIRLTKSFHIFYIVNAYYHMVARADIFHFSREQTKSKRLDQDQVDQKRQTLNLGP